MAILWTKTAYDDLDRLYQFLAVVNPNAAAKTVQPRNGGWTGVSVHFAGFLTRRDDDAGFTLLGGTTPSGRLQNVQSHP